MSVTDWKNVRFPKKKSLVGLTPGLYVCLKHIFIDVFFDKVWSNVNQIIAALNQESKNQLNYFSTIGRVRNMVRTLKIYYTYVEMVHR